MASGLWGPRKLFTSSRGANLGQALPKHVRAMLPRPQSISTPLREVEQCALGHTAGKQQGWAQTPALSHCCAVLTPERACPATEPGAEAAAEALSGPIAASCTSQRA